ncbi:hypothetical protein DF185_06860 [Marinifilum breve]|uniref:Uncharacterized protein n=2 Tax=Marinifilum breve TaxID=2184082 RepID=A0A2V4A0T5_9BACT|nr:hypothetical protein DF185_06860 [Marinifilum breve]
MGLLTGCLDDNDEYIYHNHDNSVVLLKINYTDFEFEGGIEIFLHSEFNESTNIPISVDYVSPGDFGSISLYYEPREELIFEGSIVWAGSGERSFPKYIYHPDNFLFLEEEITKPADERFQIIFSEEGVDYPLEDIWNSINDLAIVNRYLKGGKNIGLFRYTPSVGVGDPNEWSWYVIMNTVPD